MSSTVEAVREHLRRDLILRVGLSRGIINLRRTSRWLIEKNGWDATEEAVVSALRRHVPEVDAPTFEEALALLERAQSGVRTGLALVAAPRFTEERHRSARTWELLEGTETLGVFPGRKGTTYLVAEKDLHAVRQLCARVGVQRVVHPVSQVRLSFPDVGPELGVAVAIFVGAIGYQGVQLLEVFSSADEVNVLVPDEDTEAAHEVVVRLRRDG